MHKLQCMLDNEIQLKNNLFRLKLTFRPRRRPSSERSVQSPFAAQFRGEQVVIDVGELVRPLVSVHRLGLLLPDMYRLLDPSVHPVAFSVDDFGLIPIYDVVEGDSMICDC